MKKEISASDFYLRQRIPVVDSEMAYIDTGGEGDAIIFLHGNPTSSYLWRNIIPHLEDLGRCIAPDLIGMGESGKAPDGSYHFVNHARYLDTLFEELDLGDNIFFVLHDWGSGLGFNWSRRNSQRVQGIAYMEALVQPLDWEDWPEASRRLFKGMKSEAGEKLILERNLFIERILPGSVLRELTEEEMEAYRRPFLEEGESRRPMLAWPRELPMDEQPQDVVALVEGYAQWMAENDLPKLFINAEPGGILIGKQREFCRTWKNQQEVTVPGIHFIQEDSLHEIGQAIRAFIQPLRSL